MKLPPVRLEKCATPVKALRLRSDERASTHFPTTCTALTRCGLMEINPHRESGARFGLRQTLDRHGHSTETTHGQRDPDDSGTDWATPLERSFLPLADSLNVWCELESKGLKRKV